MKITYVGHACFLVESGDFKIILDPYSDDYVPGYKNIDEKVNMVLTSHDHEDHRGAKNVEIISKDESPFEITVIDTYHDNQKGELRGMNKIHILSDGKHKVAHFGDLCCEPTEEEKKLLSNLDAIMIPVGGKYTLDGGQARSAIEQLNPRVAIPMHFRSEKHGFGFPDIAILRRFTSLCSSVLELKTSTIDLDDEFAGTVVVLKPQNI